MGKTGGLFITKLGKRQAKYREKHWVENGIAGLEHREKYKTGQGENEQCNALWEKLGGRELPSRC